MNTFMLSFKDLSLLQSRNLPLLLVSLFLTQLLGCETPGLEHVEHPETGYVLPPASDVGSIHIIAREGITPAQFDAPQNSWDDILAALTPSQVDPKPAAWCGLADVAIRTKDGKLIHVDTYVVRNERVGAFSVGSGEARKSYRGGNTSKLEDALRRAYDEFVRQQRERESGGWHWRAGSNLCATGSASAGRC
jgi:hypothetical protein